MLELIVVVTVPVDAGREHCELYITEEPKTNYLKLGRNRRCILSHGDSKGARIPTSVAGHNSQFRMDRRPDFRA